MKKTLIALFLILALSLTVLTACDGDDNLLTEGSAAIGSDTAETAESGTSPNDDENSGSETTDIGGGSAESSSSAESESTSATGGNGSDREYTEFY